MTGPDYPTPNHETHPYGNPVGSTPGPSAARLHPAYERQQQTDSPNPTPQQLEAANEVHRHLWSIAFKHDADRLRSYWNLGAFIAELLGITRVGDHQRSRQDVEEAVNRFGPQSLLTISEQTGIGVFDLLFAVKFFIKCPAPTLVEMCNPKWELSEIRFRRSEIAELLGNRSVDAECFASTIAANLETNRPFTHKRSQLTRPFKRDGRAALQGDDSDEDE